MANPLLQHVLNQFPVEPPSKLYHYTQAVALDGILTSRAIWATDVRHLNDAHEFAYAVQRAKTALTVYHTQCRENGERALTSAFLDALDTSIDMGVYAASFSEAGDRLSQWRAYTPAHGGFSIGFDGQALAKHSGKRLLPCVYSPERQELLIGELFGEALNRYRAETSRVSDDEIVRHRLANQFLEAFLVLGAVLKDPGFEEEREWRLVAYQPQTGSLTPSYRAGRGGFVPYVPVSVALVGSDPPIREVVVGPAPHQSLSVGSTLGFLRSRLQSPPTVRPSTIPYRGW